MCVCVCGSWVAVCDVCHQMKHSGCRLSATSSTSLHIINSLLIVSCMFPLYWFTQWHVFMWCTIVLMYCKRDTQLLQLELFARLFSDVLLCISINSKQRTILFYHFCLSVHWMLILCQDECTCRQTFSTNTLVFPCYIWPWNSNRKGPLTVPNF